MMLLKSEMALEEKLLDIEKSFDNPKPRVSANQIRYDLLLAACSLLLAPPLAAFSQGSIWVLTCSGSRD